MSIYRKAVSAFCLKKMPSIVDNLSVRKDCVDDFAIRKRFSYGTIMVDLETHSVYSVQVVHLELNIQTVLLPCRIEPGNQRQA